MSKYNQQQRQNRSQIKQKILNEREEIQEQIDDNRESKILNKIKQFKGESMKKCQFCYKEGKQEDILKHMKNSHTDDFLNMGDNINKYSKCEVCKKLLGKKNIEEHQIICTIKENNRKAAREKNKVINLKRRNECCIEINNKEKKEKHKNLLKEFGIDTEVDPNYIIQSQESDQSQSEFMSSKSDLYKTKKKLKTNEEKEDNELTFQTLKKIPLKQPMKSQNESFTNMLGESDLNNEDQEGDTTKKKQLSQ